jgi:hypothetical protein
MWGMLKRHEVEILLKAGHTKTEVARLSGVSLRSVKRIAQEEPVVHVDDEAERNQRQIGRPSCNASHYSMWIFSKSQQFMFLAFGVSGRLLNAGERWLVG